MTKTPFRETIQALFDEFLDLRKQRDEIDTKMAQLSTAIEGHRQFCARTNRTNARSFLTPVRTLNSR